MASESRNFNFVASTHHDSRKPAYLPRSSNKPETLLMKLGVHMVVMSGVLNQSRLDFEEIARPKLKMPCCINSIKENRAGVIPRVLEVRKKKVSDDIEATPNRNNHPYGLKVS